MGGKQYEQYGGKKQVVSQKVIGIKDSSKTVIGNWDKVSKYDLGRHYHCR